MTAYEYVTALPGLPAVLILSARLYSFVDAVVSCGHRHERCVGQLQLGQGSVDIDVERRGLSHKC
jgi:hypothetical protein